MEQQTKYPKASIIVPVFNAEAYLSECVESILSQSEHAFELILIDDGSPDNCPAICDRYAGNDDRIRVIHKENAGVSAARNTGLDLAAGEYVVFIDSDDYVEPDYLEIMLREAQKDIAPKKTLIMTDYQPFSPDGEEKRTFPAPFCISLSGEDASTQTFRDLVFGFRVFPPYCKLYRRDIIDSEHLRFDTAEDFDFNMRYLRLVDRVRYIPAKTYHYRVAYKQYRPSNHGVLGDSEIKSAHIMANGITQFARRMGVYETVKPEIERWAAKKHYFNRLPMLFAESPDVGRSERRQLYRRLIGDPVYRSAFKRGIRAMGDSTTKKIGCHADCFGVWYWFYAMQKKRQ